MAAEEVRFAGRTGLGPLGEGAVQDGQALRPLRVAPGWVEAGEVGVAYELDRRTASARVDRSAPLFWARPTR